MLVFLGRSIKTRTSMFLEATKKNNADGCSFDDNPLAWFKQFQETSNTSALGQRGMAYVGLEKFYADAAAGILPQVSYIIGPAELSEHPPYQPRDGAWLQRKVVKAVSNGKNYKNTALIIIYDGM